MISMRTFLGQRYRYIYGGNSTCSWMRLKHYETFHMILVSMYQSFPDRAHRRPVVGDCCPVDPRRDCPYHPKGSHKGGTMVDMNYFTWAGNNCTQQAITPRYWPVTSIWDGQEVSPEFDTERNWAFVTTIKYWFPQSQVIMDKRLVAAIKQVQPSSKLKRAIGRFISADEPGRRNHHLHMHISLSNEIREKDA